MEIKHFIVPAAAYPRYRYAREHLVPLLQRFRKLSQKCNITDPFEIPQFEDVNIYTISDTSTDIINVEELTPKPNSDIKQTILKVQDVRDFQNKCPDTAAAIYIASYSKAILTDSNLFQYLGRCSVLIAEDETEIQVTTPDIRTIDDRITCVKTRASVAKEMGYLLERILFQELKKRVTILSTFLGVDPAEAAFALH
ncbi:uncharacterized protein LOC132723572 [Ruditapes philippinarum]|uniref:uncharacterized protein LOC132723572 n=1 Tax=Ruditapes philippinarum TaxID=129788 RepID=UPI00295AF7DB|nr:uncharacterized protein LOC132723572 [Ruditapes philippinarum]XP_060564305.1 uncharacterized protein LOC132723572 [Ruditapes philippinarum]